jgi:hypothetical protein
MIVARLQLALGAIVLWPLASFTPGEDSAAARELPRNGNIAYVMKPLRKRGARTRRPRLLPTMNR